LQLQRNLGGEAIAFEDGMSISDLMDRHATILPYKSFGNWSSELAYCMLGDWILGYYINYYGVGSDRYDNAINPFSRIDGRLGSIYKTEERSCLNTGINSCRLSEFKYFCHRLDADGMAIMQRYDRLKSALAKSSLDNLEKQTENNNGDNFNPLRLEPIKSKGHKQVVKMNNITCRVLISHSKIDSQYYSLESIPLHHPLPWEETDCKDRGLNSSDPIVFDYFLPFYGIARVMRLKMSEAWKWMKYYEHNLQDLMRIRLHDGRFIQFGSILGHMDKNITLSLPYAAYIIASCDSNHPVHFQQARVNKNIFCVLENPKIIVPDKLKARTCFLSPKHIPDCWYLPTEYPTFSSPLPPSAQVVLRLCVPVPDSLDPLAQALNPWLSSSQVLDIELYGPAQLYRNSTNLPATLVEHLTFREDFQSYTSNHRALSQCHAMIFLLPLFNISDNNITLNKFISQAVGHRIPIVIPQHHTRQYKERLNTTRYEYDESSTQSLIKVFDEMMIDFHQIKKNEA
jgi:hypothetical protein